VRARVPPDTPTFMFLSHPALLFATSLVVLWVTAVFSRRWFVRLRAEVASEREDFTVVQGTTLTLLGLIIGFTFSMALSRYEQRKSLEEAEANAIGTEYLRADLLPAGDREKVKALLLQYLDERVTFYLARDHAQLAAIDQRTNELQNALWSSVLGPATANPTPVMALVVSGMNDVLNSQGYTQAAWWNRIPPAAWLLLFFIGLAAIILLGLGSKSPKGDARLMLVLPLVVATAFFLIADIDSPRRGAIRVLPQNLMSLAQSLRGL
jgi:hypothetical protein